MHVLTLLIPISALSHYTWMEAIKWRTGDSMGFSRKPDKVKGKSGICIIRVQVQDWLHKQMMQMFQTGKKVWAWL